jgi:hypothetical protein
MILCFYLQKVETFKEKHKIIDVPISNIKMFRKNKSKLTLIHICFMYE